jgi:hypothetical protein
VGTDGCDGDGGLFGVVDADPGEQVQGSLPVQAGLVEVAQSLVGGSNRIICLGSAAGTWENWSPKMTAARACTAPNRIRSRR